MKYPNFFDDIESIKLQDDLADFLSSTEDGLIEFNYIDVVKLAGHSCPTVAGAYLMALEGLKILYKNGSLPKRGEIKVIFSKNSLDDTTGVVANVLTQITGATETYGFKGIQNRFARHSLMSFGQDIKSDIRLQRVDNGNFVDIYYNPSVIFVEDEQKELMPKMIKNIASKDEKERFGQLWQDRVHNIFKHRHKVIKIDQ